MLQKSQKIPQDFSFRSIGFSRKNQLTQASPLLAMRKVFHLILVAVTSSWYCRFELGSSTAPTTIGLS